MKLNQQKTKDRFSSPPKSTNHLSITPSNRRQRRQRFAGLPRCPATGPGAQAGAGNSYQRMDRFASPFIPLILRMGSLTEITIQVRHRRDGAYAGERAWQTREPDFTIMEVDSGLPQTPSLDWREGIQQVPPFWGTLKMGGGAVPYMVLDGLDL